jgi:hypothetical protein
VHQQTDARLGVDKKLRCTLCTLIALLFISDFFYSYFVYFDLVKQFFSMTYINQILSRFFQKLVLAEGSTSYENWVKLPQPMHFKVYIMEVANPDEVHLGAKPFMREKGPFIYL